MISLGLTRRRLIAFLRAVGDPAGVPDLAAVTTLHAAAERRDELGAILKEGAHDFSTLLARL